MSSCEMLAKAYTPTGLKVQGTYENERNSCNADLYKAILREALGVKDVICGHHIIYVDTEKRADGFEYTVVQEMPSADAMIFDHRIARKIWGNEWRNTVVRLALEPVETRDDLLSRLYYGRKPATTVRYGGSEELEFPNA